MREKIKNLIILFCYTIPIPVKTENNKNFVGYVKIKTVKIVVIIGIIGITMLVRNLH